MKRFILSYQDYLSMNFLLRQIYSFWRKIDSRSFLECHFLNDNPVNYFMRELLRFHNSRTSALRYLHSGFTIISNNHIIGRGLEDISIILFRTRLGITCTIWSTICFVSFRKIPYSRLNSCLLLVSGFNYNNLLLKFLISQ